MTRERIITAVNWFLVGLIVVLLMAPTWADDGHGHNHHDDNGDNVLTGGDASNVASIAGSRSYGVSGSDMDIGQCVYHVGGLTVAVGLRNKFCEGMEMIRSGMVDAGVLHICKQTKIGRNYDNLKDCQDGLVFLPTTNEIPITTNISSSDEEDDRVDVLYALFSDLEAQRNEDKAEAEKVAQRPVPRPQTIIQQQEFINESKRARLEAMRAEK